MKFKGGVLTPTLLRTPLLHMHVKIIQQ